MPGYTCNTTTVSSSNQDLSSCQTIDGDLIITATDTVSINGPVTVKGSVIINGTDIVSVSSPSLQKVTDKLTIEHCNKLQDVSFKNMRSVRTVNLLSLAVLNSFALGSGVTQVDTMTITDTNIADLTGIDINTINTLQLETNSNLKSFESNIKTINTTFIISTNGNRNMSVSMPNLVSVNNVQVSGVGAFDVPSLKSASSLRFAENENMQMFQAPNLTQVGENTKNTGSLSFTDNAMLTNLSFPNLPKITGDLTIANNTAMKNITGFPKLTGIFGALVLGGNFTSVDLPKLTKVAGTADVRSFSPIADNFCDNQFKNFQATQPTCKGNATEVPTGNNGQTTTDGGKKGGSGSGASTMAVSAGAMLAAIFVGAVQLL